MKTINYFLYTLAICITLSNTDAQAQDVPFNCDFNAYLFQNNDVYALDLASGNSYVVATDVAPGNINATGYNPADGYIWGALSSPDKAIIRIGQNFETTVFTIPELPSNNGYVGDVSSDGTYYLKPGGSTFYKIDINPDSDNYGNYSGQGSLSQNLSIHDWAFNAVDGNLYAVEKNSNHLYRIDPETGTVADLGEVPILSGYEYTYGAVYFDLSGRFYVSANQTGTVFVIQNVQDITTANQMDSNLFAYGPASSSNDGARCPTAPVPQEICGNGIDDDGDGLIDCDDPSCSGVQECPVAEDISSGNRGGLESNNRLSQKISQRNFERKKSGYSFDKKTARKIEKKSDYGTPNRSSDLIIEDFIPQDILEQTEAIESTPYDLIEITNATEIISVDYVREDETVAALMIFKTEDGVYEHTKYICDRLVGAELISVSTIELNGQNFIKSIIKNEDGNTEFVLSLSAKLTNQEANFAIESHWNLDAYEQDVEFYNFQVWTNSLDDLLNLSTEILNLIEIQRPITSYNLSTPPTVFVKKGSYSNGMLQLDIVNTNNSESITIDAGLRQTETSETEYVSIDKDLPTALISSHTIETGPLFDIGFRIHNGTSDTPDDLFLSDGPWGLDDFAMSTQVSSYEITPNQNQDANYELAIERNVSVTATTSEYISVYRAFTPKFQSVDLSDYTMLEFDAFGTGDMQVTLVKESISVWENQHRTTVTLLENNDHYYIPLSAFTSNENQEIDATDITTIIFTMISENGENVTKEMHISNLGFSSILSNEDVVAQPATSINISPNPVNETSTIQFYSEETEPVTLTVYNMIGKQVYSETLQTNYGLNNLPLNSKGLKTGIYIYELKSQKEDFIPGKFIVK